MLLQHPRLPDNVYTYTIVNSIGRAHSYGVDDGNLNENTEKYIKALARYFVCSLLFFHRCDVVVCVLVQLSAHILVRSFLFFCKQSGKINEGSKRWATDIGISVAESFMRIAHNYSNCRNFLFSHFCYILCCLLIAFFFSFTFSHALEPWRSSRKWFSIFISRSPHLCSAYIYESVAAFVLSQLYNRKVGIFSLLS